MVDGGDALSTTVSAKYEGTYLYSCALLDEDKPGGGYSVITIVIEGATLSATALNYTDAACTQPGFPAELELVSSLSYPGGMAQTALGAADFVDTTVESGTVNGQPLSAALNQLFTTEGLFDTNHDIVLLAGSSLYSGDNSTELDGGSVQTRPNALESIPAVRQ
jgi:hypothetical protein